MDPAPLSSIVHCGDSLAVLRTLPSSSVHCVVTSPPYFWLRDYEHADQIGMEESLGQYIAKLRAVFFECHRVLRDDGTLWLNIGDTYTTRSRGAHGQGPVITGVKARSTPRIGTPAGMQPKELIGVPWRVAFAIRRDGWILRAENIWHKRNPQPESTKDRTCRAHEQVFHFSKSYSYFYDYDAVKEPATGGAHARGERGGGPKMAQPKQGRGRNKYNTSMSKAVRGIVDDRNLRSVWSMTSEPTRDKHSSAFPKRLARNCILAGCPRGGIVLDPFAGRGTTGIVALAHGRSFVGIELVPEMAELAQRNVLDSAERAGVLSLELAKKIRHKPHQQLGLLAGER